MRHVGTVSSLFLGLILCCTVPSYADAGKTYKPQSVEVYFSPKGGATEAVVSVIEKARKTIYVQAYSFTSAPIAKAIVDAHKRGVAVNVILDNLPSV